MRMQAGPKPPGPPSTGSLHLPDDLDFDALSLHSREPSPAVMLHPRSSQPAAAPADPSPWSDAPSPQGKLWEAPFPLVSPPQTGCEGYSCVSLLEMWQPISGSLKGLLGSGGTLPCPWRPLTSLRGQQAGWRSLDIQALRQVSGKVVDSLLMSDRTISPLQFFWWDPPSSCAASLMPAQPSCLSSNHAITASAFLQGCSHLLCCLYPCSSQVLTASQLYAKSHISK